MLILWQHNPEIQPRWYGSTSSGTILCRLHPLPSPLKLRLQCLNVPLISPCIFKWLFSKRPSFLKILYALFFSLLMSSLLWPPYRSNSRWPAQTSEFLFVWYGNYSLIVHLIFSRPKNCVRAFVYDSHKWHPNWLSIVCFRITKYIALGPDAKCMYLRAVNHRTVSTRDRRNCAPSSQY